MAGPANGLMSLEPTVDASLSQQSDIDAKLALLLPQKYALSARAELVHLRHKLRVLRTFANEHREPCHFCSGCLLYRPSAFFIFLFFLYRIAVQVPLAGPVPSLPAPTPTAAVQVA